MLLNNSTFPFSHILIGHQKVVKKMLQSWQNGLFQKKSTPPPPRRMVRFFDPPSHPDFQGQRTPPPPLPPGFPLFFTSPKFILQAIENKTHVAFGCFIRYSFRSKPPLLPGFPAPSTPPPPARISTMLSVGGVWIFSGINQSNTLSGGHG